MAYYIFHFLFLLIAQTDGADSLVGKTSGFHTRTVANSTDVRENMAEVMIFSISLDAVALYC